MLAQPSMIKRPVLEAKGKLTVASSRKIIKSSSAKRYSAGTPCRLEAAGIGQLQPGPTGNAIEQSAPAAQYHRTDHQLVIIDQTRCHSCLTMLRCPEWSGPDHRHVSAWQFPRWDRRAALWCRPSPPFSDCGKRHTSAPGSCRRPLRHHLRRLGRGPKACIIS